MPVPLLVQRGQFGHRSAELFQNWNYAPAGPSARDQPVRQGICFEEWNIETGMFSNPEVNLQSAILSLLVLVICGALAGLVPATKAARINPIEALHAE